LTNGGLLSKLVERLEQNREVCKNCQKSSHSSSTWNHQKFGRPMMLERGVRSNWAKNVTLEDETVDIRVDADRFWW